MIVKKNTTETGSFFWNWRKYSSIWLLSIRKEKFHVNFFFRNFIFTIKTWTLNHSIILWNKIKKILNFVISNWFYVSRMIFVIVVHSISQWDIERWCWKQEKDREREREIKDKLSDKLFNDYTNNNNKTNLNSVIPRIKFFFFFLLWTIRLLCVCLRWFIFKNNDYFEMNLIEFIHWKSISKIGKCCHLVEFSRNIIIYFDSDATK